jgi:hypothetical protein
VLYLRPRPPSQLETPRGGPPCRPPFKDGMRKHHDQNRPPLCVPPECRRFSATSTIHFDTCWPITVHPSIRAIRSRLQPAFGVAAFSIQKNLCSWFCTINTFSHRSRKEFSWSPSLSLYLCLCLFPSKFICKKLCFFSTSINKNSQWPTLSHQTFTSQRILASKPSFPSYEQALQMPAKRRHWCMKYL